MTISLTDRLKLIKLTRDNPAMSHVVSRITKLEAIDDKCAIMFLDGNTEWYYKYVINPLSGDSKSRLLNDRLSGIVKRGLAHQFMASSIPGVQKITESNFILDEKTGERIVGLIGKLRYIPGEILSEAEPIEPHKLKDIFQRFEEETLDGMRDKRIIHGDLKPENLILNSEGRLILIDWSLATSYSEDYQDFIEREVRGSPGYFHRDINRSVDGYSLGISFATSLIPYLRLAKAPKHDLTQVPRRKKLDIILANIAERLESEVDANSADYFSGLVNQKREYDIETFMREEVDRVYGSEPEYDSSEDMAKDGTFVLNPPTIIPEESLTSNETIIY